jgi:hypothetical protein
VTVDEELNLLESQMRRLKIEYEIYFSNPTKKPPTDVEWKVLSLLRKFSDGGKLSFSQRFRYNEMAQRYAIYSDLWRKKVRRMRCFPCRACARCRSKRRNTAQRTVWQPQPQRRLPRGLGRDR